MIPRAELVAPLLLVRITTHVAGLLHVYTKQLYAWTDSMIVLHWLQKQSAVYHPQDLCCKSGLCHTKATTIDSMVSCNHQGQPCWPAQLGNRCQGSHTLPALVEGSSMASLLSCTVAHQDANSQECPSQTKTSCYAIRIIAPPRILWKRFSSCLHLTSVVAWIIRFYHNSRKTGHRRLTTSSLPQKSLEPRPGFSYYPCMNQHSRMYWKLSNIADLCQRVIPLPDYYWSRMKTDSFVSAAEWETLLLPRIRRDWLLSIQSDLTRLLIKTLHTTYGHPGITAMTSILYDIYYITGLRSFLKKMSKNCPACQRAYTRPFSYQMEMLPSYRTTPASPFCHTAVDFAGPFHIRTKHTHKPVII